MKIKRKKKETTRFQFDIRKFLFDKRLNISMLSKVTGLSRYTFISAREQGFITVPTLLKLKDNYQDAENYIEINRNEQ